MSSRTLIEPTAETVWKMVILGIGSAVFLIGYCSMGLVLVNKDWQPFKAKQPYVLLLSLLSSTCWWIGNLQALGVIDQVDVFSICVLWGVWMQVVFGVLLYLVTMIFRLLRLYFILVLSRPAEGLVYWMIIGLCYLPAVIMGMIPVVFPGKFMSQVPVVIAAQPNGDLACDFFDPLYANSLLGSSGLLLLVLYFLNYKISTVRKAFNEYKYEFL
jgi:hypothetical protein